MTPLLQSASGSSSGPSSAPAPAVRKRSRQRWGGARRAAGPGRSRLVLVGAAMAAAGVTGVAYRRLAALGVGGDEPDDGSLSLGWGEGVSRPDFTVVRTGDGAELAVWDLAGEGPDAPAVVLPHCWGCSHEIWLPVARRLRDRRASASCSTTSAGTGRARRGTAPLAIETLAHDLADVLEATDVHDAVLAGHSMGGMTIMSLATHRPDVLTDAGQGDRARGDRRHEPRAAARRKGRGWRPRLSASPRRQPGDAVQERARLRALRLRGEPGARAHGSDPRPLRELPRSRAG